MFSLINNYLRSYRKRSGLSQREVAFLLGSEDGAQVSRYEKGHRLPPLRTALAYTTIFGVSLGTLFAGIQIGIERAVSARIRKLRDRIEKRREQHWQTAADMRKLRWFDERGSNASHDSDSTA